MAIPATVSNYLSAQGIDYHVLPHPHTERAVAAASVLHIPPERLAKGVVIAIADSVPPRYLLAVLPASRVIDQRLLGDVLGALVHLAPETALTALFPDCAPGAVPALGRPYHLDSVIDSHLALDAEVYFEAGDHAEVIRISGSQFAGLCADAVRGSFSYDRLQDEFRR